MIEASLIVDTTEGPQYPTKDDPLPFKVILTLESEPMGFSYSGDDKLYLVNNSTSVVEYDLTKGL